MHKKEKDTIANRYNGKDNRHNNPAIANGGLDFSDVSEAGRRLVRKTHQTVKKVTTDIERDYHFNTAIAALMELVNEMMGFEPAEKRDLQVLKFALENALLLISPFTPHIAEELWNAIGNEPSISRRNWPVWDEEMAKEEEVELVIQVNGKLRGKLMIPQGLTDEEAKTTALADRKTLEFIGGREIKKVIVVKGRLVNIVVGG